jgi:glutathione S-transferase
MAKHRFALPQEWRVPAVIETAAKEFAAALKVLESGLGAKPFIVGESFSAADILLGHTLGWARKYEMPMDSPAILAYLDRTLARPALARARLREQATA